jgi:hypothetical protein
MCPSVGMYRSSFGFIIIIKIEIQLFLPLRNSSYNISMPDLPTVIERELLKAVGRKGLPLQGISLLHLCDQEEGVIGIAGSEIRRKG